MFALFLFSLAQGLEPAPATRFDKVIALEIHANDSVLEGHGPSQRVEYDAEFSGTLHVWTKVDGTPDLFLRLEGPDGKLIAKNDNSGGGKTPYLKIDVEPGRRLTVFAAPSSGNAPCKLELHLVAAPETEATRDAEHEAMTAIEEVKRLREVKDLDAARALAVKTIDALVAVAGAGESDLVCGSLWKLGFETYAMSILQPTRLAWGQAWSHRTRTLPEEHPDLQVVRNNLAVTMRALGDLRGARALQEKVLEVSSRIQPDEDLDLQDSRLNFAITLHDLGDLPGAQGLEEKVLEVFSRTLADEDQRLQAVRNNLAIVRQEQGDLRGARALQEKVLEVFTRTLSGEHPSLQAARGNLALTMKALGDLQGARKLEEKVLEVRSRTLPDEHPELQMARNNLAVTIGALGDLRGARALQEKVLEILSCTRPEDDADLQMARSNLATTLEAVGDLQGARALLEKVLQVFSRTLPNDHPNLQVARGNLAATLAALGDPQGARVLDEKVLEVLSRTLADEDPRLQAVRLNLAIVIQDLGDLLGARVLEEKVLEVRSQTLPEEHPDLQSTRLDLATTLDALGDLQGAHALLEKVLLVSSRTLSDEHPDLQMARLDLALTIVRELARAGGSSGGEGERTRESEGGRDRCAKLMGALCRAQVQAAREVILECPGREAEERCVSLAISLDSLVSLAMGYGVVKSISNLESQSFTLAETTRGAALVSAELMHRATNAPKYGELRGALQAASNALATIVREGTTTEEFDRARVKRELAERELVAMARELSGEQQSGLDVDVDAIARRLDEHEVAVVFRQFKRSRVDVVDQLDSTGQRAVRESSILSLCAFVVRSTTAGGKKDPAAASPLTLVDLGPIAPIEDAVRAWRETLGIASDSRGRGADSQANALSSLAARGAAVRILVFDPLLPALAGSSHLVVALDEVLHLVPLEVLPLSDSHELVGDRWRIETRATLTELLQEPAPFEGSGKLVAFGDIDYQSDGVFTRKDDAGSAAAVSGTTNAASNRPVTQQDPPIAEEPNTLTQPAALHPGSAEAQTGLPAPRSDKDAGILRGSAWSKGFSPLPATGDEVRGIVHCFAEQFGTSAESELCDQQGATRERLLSLASRSRYLHIATHGWFASESIKSWSDVEPLDKKSGLWLRMDGGAQVKGMSPMLLCGLALAGANLPENALGRVPGLVTAEELSTLDLTNCDLVVLSACDTNVGERRAGQGVHSLQMALQMAGARSVITSLWKVPDEATKELMLDFYRRLWVEKKPKWQALWEAKRKLREAKDDSGKPKYSTRDWAAWVLTGDPN